MSAKRTGGVESVEHVRSRKGLHATPTLPSKGGRIVGACHKVEES
jgi:hypothetical protein